MPLPTKKTGESKEDFIQRCMGDSKIKEEFPDTKQRYVVCIAQSKK